MIKYIKEDYKQINKMPLECIKGATLLSEKEYLKYVDSIPLIYDEWWLSSAGHNNYEACSVCYDGSVFCCCDVDKDRGGVRPALILDIQSSNLEIGDKFEFDEHSFTIISNDLAICDDLIEKCCFREDWKAIDANIYEKSDVKKVVNNWFDKAYSYEKLELKTPEEIWEDENWGF